MEGIFISLWVILPYVFDKVMSYDGLKLLNKPVYLTKEYTIGNFNQLHQKRNEDADKDLVNIDQMYSDNENKKIKKNEEENDYIPKNTYLATLHKKLNNIPWIKLNLDVHPQYTDTKQRRFRYKYGLSGWFYLNPQPPNTRSAYTKYTNILKYGNKVKVEYNGKLGSLRVLGEKASESNKTDKKNKMVVIYETTSVLYQKWNNIVINYDNGYIDVFLNGILVGAISGVAPYMSFDNIIVGEIKGLQGAICNVTYYDKPLTKSAITLTYKTLREKKLPYVWRLTDSIDIRIKKNEAPNKKFITDLKNMVGA